MSDFEQGIAEIAEKATATDVAPLVKALTAVLSLHHPFDRRMGSSRYTKACADCLDDNGVLGVPWPCPTVRAVWDVLDPGRKTARVVDELQPGEME